MNPILLDPGPGPWDIPKSFAWCRDLARRHYENFPVASLLVPTQLRQHVAAVYAFARIADDIADEPGASPAERIRQLDRWHSHLRECTDRPPQHPAFIALGHTLRAHNLPLALFEDLLSAFRQDASTHRYAVFTDLLEYCRRSAHPVGRIILHLFGHHDPTIVRMSDDICTALQLTNFWQDFSQDLSRGRVYVPEEDLRSFGLDPNVAGWERHPAFIDVIRFEVVRTRAFFEKGKDLPHRVKSPLSWQIRMTLQGGWRVLDKIERSGYTVASQRPRLNGWDALVVGVRGLKTS